MASHEWTYDGEEEERHGKQSAKPGDYLHHDVFRGCILVRACTDADAAEDSNNKGRMLVREVKDAERGELEEPKWTTVGHLYKTAPPVRTRCAHGLLAIKRRWRTCSPAPQMRRCSRRTMAPPIARHTWYRWTGL